MSTPKTPEQRAGTRSQARADPTKTSVVREWISGSDEMKPVDHRRLLNLRWPKNSFYIPDDRLENLKAYRYSGTDKSLVSVCHLCREAACLTMAEDGSRQPDLLSFPFSDMY